MTNREFRCILTEKCNYKCWFCHKETLQNRPKRRLSSNEWLLIFKEGRKYFGHGKITFTGGEPLAWEDIVKLSQDAHGNGAEITITSNGFLLDKRMEIGSYIKKLNISIHSMTPKIYCEMTNSPSDSLDKVKSNLNRFRELYPTVNIVLNSTPIRGYTFDWRQIESLLNFAGDIDAQIKFIELYPPVREGFVSLSELQILLESIGFTVVSSDFRKINLSRGKIIVKLTQVFCSFAKEQNHPALFCEKNNDVFITPEGKIKPCRHSALEFDIKGLQGGAFFNTLEKVAAHIGDGCVYKKTSSV